MRYAFAAQTVPAAGTFPLRELFSDPGEIDGRKTQVSPGARWDISDLTNELDHGRTMAQTPSFLCRDKDEVRQKAKELGLTLVLKRP
jgi:hypothetical protein